MFIFNCTSVEDHGHCAVASYATADNNSSLSLYIYAGDAVPTVGDLLSIPWATVPQVIDQAAASQPENDGSTAQSDHGSGAGHQYADPTHDPDHGSVDLGTDGRSAGATLGGTIGEQLLPAGVGGVDGIAPLPVVTDPEVHEEGEGAPTMGAIPLSVDISEKPVDAGDLQV